MKRGDDYKSYRNRKNYRGIVWTTLCQQIT